MATLTAREQQHLEQALARAHQALYHCQRLFEMKDAYDDASDCQSMALTVAAALEAEANPRGRLRTRQIT